MKKTIIIMGSLVLVAIIALILVIALRGGDKAAGRGGRAKMEITYEQFSQNLKDDLSQETLEEVEALFEELQDADTEGKAAIFKELNDMGVLKEIDRSTIGKRGD